MFGEGGSVGKRYSCIKLNIWTNQYLRDVRSKLLADHNIKFEMHYEKINKDQISAGMLFNDDVLKKKFYQQAKDFVRLDDTEQDKEKIA